MNFEKLIELRRKYPFITGSHDDLYDAIINGVYEYDFALLTVSILSKYGKELLKEHYIDMLIQIPSPFEFTSINFCMIHLANSKPIDFLTGVYKGDVFLKYKKSSANVGGFGRVGQLTEEYEDFLNNINQYFSNKEINRDDLNVCSYSKFDDNYFNPVYYTKQAIKIREEYNENDYVLLKDFADITTIPTHKEIKARCLYSTNFTYPLKIFDIQEKEIKRAIKVEKYDIVGLLNGDRPKFYLYLEDYNDVFVNAGGYCIIKCRDKKYNSYLVNYLNDEKALTYFQSVNKGTYISHMSVKDLMDLKVLKPTEKMMKTADDSLKLLIDAKKMSIYDINQLLRENHQLEFEKESQKMIYDDLLKPISNLKFKVIKDLINDDLKEVEQCFEHDAYKAAIIMCGSILEAVLLDWLSEYEDADSILNVALNEEGRDLELSRIITKLKKFIKPYWYEASKAHEIRVTRNMVHPKECIKNNKKVDYEECKKIIDDLNEILAAKENKYN